METSPLTGAMEVPSLLPPLKISSSYACGAVAMSIGSPSSAVDTPPWGVAGRFARPRSSACSSADWTAPEGRPFAAASELGAATAAVLCAHGYSSKGSGNREDGDAVGGCSCPSACSSTCSSPDRLAVQCSCCSVRAKLRTSHCEARTPLPCEYASLVVATALFTTLSIFKSMSVSIGVASRAWGGEDAEGAERE